MFAEELRLEGILIELPKGQEDAQCFVVGEDDFSGRCEPDNFLLRLELVDGGQRAVGLVDESKEIAVRPEEDSLIIAEEQVGDGAYLVIAGDLLILERLQASAHLQQNNQNESY